MDNERKKALQREYKEMTTYYGVIQIKNNHNGKIFLDTVPNTKNRWHFYKLNLCNNFYRHTDLQTDWNEQGETAFSYEVLWEKKTDDVIDMKFELKQLKKNGSKNYNRLMKKAIISRCAINVYKDSKLEV